MPREKKEKQNSEMCAFHFTPLIRMPTEDNQTEIWCETCGLKAIIEQHFYPVELDHVALSKKYWWYDIPVEKPKVVRKKRVAKKKL
jgi:hypothetical protein